jgi:hypothetical protein
VRPAEALTALKKGLVADGATIETLTLGETDEAALAWRLDEDGERVGVSAWARIGDWVLVIDAEQPCAQKAPALLRLGLRQAFSRAGAGRRGR